MALAKVQLRNFGLQGIRYSVASLDGLQRRQYSTPAELTKSTSTAAIRRGTGGRSSFNGVVATVFGCSGFLGRYVANGLGKLGTQVVIPYRGDHYFVLRLKLVGDLGQVLFFPYHLKDEESLYKAMKYSNVVINLVGKDRETSNFSFEDVHVTGARNIARIAKECGVKRLIHVSALSAVEKPTPLIIKSGSKFLASKWRGEQAVREEFPEATIFRPSVMWGTEDRFLHYYASRWRYGLSLGEMPLWKKGKQTIKQPVFVSDVAQGIVNAVFDEGSIGQTYQAIGPRRYELKEIIDWFHRVMLKGDEETGHRITDLKYSPFFWLKASVMEKLYAKNSRLTWEKLEFDHTTDVVTPGLPTLEDLGVELTTMEDRLPIELRPYRAMSSYNDEFGEFAPPVPPKMVAAEI